MGRQKNEGNLEHASEHAHDSTVAPAQAQASSPAQASAQHPHAMNHAIVGSEPPHPPLPQGKGSADLSPRPHHPDTAHAQETTATAPLAVDDIPNSPRNHRISIVLTVSLLCVMAIFILSGTWYWWNNYRRFSVSINNESMQVTGKQSLDSILKNHNYFGTKPGALKSLTGKTLKANGGEAIVIKLNSHRISPSQFDSTHLHSNDIVTVSTGSDETEGHTVEKKTIPYSATMKLGGAVQFVAQQGEDGKQEYWVGKDSGETVPKKVIAQPKTLQIDSINPRPPADKKVIALTFDDGPSQYSTPILQILKSKGVKATFMDIGNQSTQMSQIEQQMLADGNQVVSHSYSHPDLTTLNRDALRKELTSGFNALKTASNSTTRMLRAPYGSFNKETWMNSSDIVSSNILWTIDTQDWKQPGENAIKNEVMNNAYSGAIVLMHDGGGNRTQDIHVLPDIIDSLKSQGYQFVTMNELISMDGRFPDWVKNNVVAPKPDAQ
ncbi:polysaccharide deacetylase family protein [Bifidobacterium aquikefiri]|uniref:polysaccharide deacetylase family protein n=1 Tax=Bifidobacterium aquikefiri TaxID=1653207 RepID=UPI0039EC5ACB